MSTSMKPTTTKERRPKVKSKSKYYHGWSHHRICNVWHGMIARCYRAGHRSYGDYGGRGISVCERWRESIQAFIDDMGLPPSRKHSIDRINNDGNYEPGNCRWATMAEQNRNNRHTVMLTFNGKTQCMLDWSNELGINYDRLIGRFRRGWTTDEALTGICPTPTYADRVLSSVINFHERYEEWPTLRFVTKNTKSKVSEAILVIESLPCLSLLPLNERSSTRHTLVVCASPEQAAEVDLERFCELRGRAKAAITIADLAPYLELKR